MSEQVHVRLTRKKEDKGQGAQIKERRSIQKDGRDIFTGSGRPRQGTPPPTAREIFTC